MKNGENNKNNNDLQNKNPFFQSQDNVNDANRPCNPDDNGAVKFKILQGGKTGGDRPVGGEASGSFPSAGGGERGAVKHNDRRALKQRSAYEEIAARGLRMLDGGKSGADANCNADAGISGGAGFDGDARFNPGNGFNGHAGSQNACADNRPPQRLTNPLSIVVVDENPAVLLTIMSTLQPCGYAVRTYKSAYDALIAIKNEPCNVLIATEKMKQMSGSALAEFARSAGDARHILLLADRWDTNVVNFVRREHIDGYLIKPLSRNELLDKLNALMDIT